MGETGGEVEKFIKMISIIIPIHNNAKTLPKCLPSIFAQTVKPAEIIFVDDGSKDYSLEILKKIIDEKNPDVKTKIVRQVNKGAPAARNRGFDESSGKFVLFLDADVIMKPEMLEKMLKALKNNPGCSYAYSSFKLGQHKMKAQKFDAQKLKKINYISTMSLIEREHFPRFDESLKKFQDWDLWLTMLEKDHTGVATKEILFKAIPNKKGMSRWLPKFAYKLPWKFGVVKEYDKRREIIKKKHGL